MAETSLGLVVFFGDSLETMALGWQWGKSRVFATRPQLKQLDAKLADPLISSTVKQWKNIGVDMCVYIERLYNILLYIYIYIYIIYCILCFIS